MTTVLVDTHVLHWLTAEPELLSPAASRAIDGATEIAVAAITWYELSWLAANGRITLAVPMRSWLDGLAEGVNTASVTPSIAATAVELPSSFPGDPADRLIYATAVERGWQLVTKDRKLRKHRHPRPVTIW